MRITTIIAVLLAGATLSAAPSRIIARIGTKAVTYEEIQCRVASPNCARLEQASLDRILTRELLDAAAKKYSIEPSPAEIDRAVPRGFDPVATSARIDAMAHALLQILRGGNEEEARKEWLDPRHISKAELDIFRRNFHSAEQVEKYLHQDNAGLMRTSVEQQKRRELIASRLRSRIADEAKRSGRKEADVAAQLWSDLASSDGIVIVDAGYHLPTTKGILIP
jgi:hypothetical protein